ncbi:unnamed protein product [Aphis gossypii]|uniref:NTF2 domain-containing protein n=1 Tax=Aphis gossypii TaxID=80765 RepID=A0A9P0JBV0_APHGO|nr:unnamed protein product [Aphis gossypii]
MSEDEPQMSMEPSAIEFSDVTKQPVRDFVYRYYTTLAGVPHDAWRFFTVDAQYTHVDGCGPEEARDPGPAVGQYQIHVNITHQRFTECQFLIRSINEQPVTNGRVHVLVTGDTSRSKQPADSFVQSFMLKYLYDINQYAVTNSILKVYTSSPPLPRSPSPLSQPQYSSG